MAKQTNIKARNLKIETVKSLAQKIAKAKAVVFVNYHGLAAGQISQLRNKLKEVGGELVVTKNTLLKRALTNYQLPASPTKRGEPTNSYQLTGPTAAIFAYQDELAPLKVVDQTTKTQGVPQFKFGFWGKDYLDAQQINQLATIPDRSILESNIVQTLASPLYSLLLVLQANLRNLVFVLDQAAKS